MINLQRPARKEGSQLLLVDSSVLPEVFLRVVEAKRMLAVGQVRSLSEAAKAAGISRSALYKYKDCVFVHNEALDDKVITLSARMPLPLEAEQLRASLLALPGVAQVDILTTR